MGALPHARHVQGLPHGVVGQLVAATSPGALRQLGPGQLGPGSTVGQHKQAIRVQSAESVPQDPSFKHPIGGRLSAPEQTWYPGGRSLSPASPRISPSPKAMKAEMSDLRIHVTPSDAGDRSVPSISVSTSSRSPLPGRVARRSAGIPHGPGPGGTSHRSSRNASKHASAPVLGHSPTRHSLNVPAAMRTKSTESNSSLSSGYYAGSSRSGTNSPVTPDVSQHENSAMSAREKWYLENPLESSEGVAQCFQRTSSTHRPLGFNVPSGNSSSSTSLSSPQITALHPSPRPRSSRQHSQPPSSRHSQPLLGDQAPHCQQEHWQRWERIAKEHGEEFHEQETLV